MNSDRCMEFSSICSRLEGDKVNDRRVSSFARVPLGTLAEEFVCRKQRNEQNSS